jgi:hypothetical protein
VAYVKTTLAKAEKRKRVRVPRFAKTEEWKAMKSDLDGGMKPGEVGMAVFDKKSQAKYRITNRRTIARYISKYVAENKLPYKIKSFASRDTGTFYVQVICPAKK